MAPGGAAGADPPARARRRPGRRRGPGPGPAAPGCRAAGRRPAAGGPARDRAGQAGLGRRSRDRLLPGPAGPSGRPPAGAGALAGLRWRSLRPRPGRLRLRPDPADRRTGEGRRRGPLGHGGRPALGRPGRGGGGGRRARGHRRPAAAAGGGSRRGPGLSAAPLEPAGGGGIADRGGHALAGFCAAGRRFRLAGQRHRRAEAALAGRAPALPGRTTGKLSDGVGSCDG